MKTTPALLSILALAANTRAALITAPPGPDDQGGMIMPMVTITSTSGTGSNPTAGTVNISFSPPYAPVLKSTQEWVPGDWYAETAAWRADLGSPAGTGGTPLANAGNGGLFNNQHGFMFMSMGTTMMANVPTGGSLAIRLDSISSASLRSFNYGNAANRWDQVFNAVDSQVLWNGSMWHNYFTLPGDAPAGNYSATFEVFVADTPFTGTTGFAQYDSAALAASKNPNFTPAFVTYNFNVIPEPSCGILSGVGVGFLLIRRKRR
jgi:hypothetical protein